MDIPPWKTCGCGATYSVKEWVALKYIGIQETEDETHVYRIELRNCAKCGSTIGVETFFKKSDFKKEKMRAEREEDYREEFRAKFLELIKELSKNKKVSDAYFRFENFLMKK